MKKLRIIEADELKNILTEHEKWLKTGHKEGKRADLYRAYLKNTNLRGAYLEGADLREAYLEGADLTMACLRDADLRKADLTGAKLRSADLRGADLDAADVVCADLEKADLEKARLTNAVFYSANLIRANLAQANLRYSSLRDADLSYADLYSADLKGADLRDTNLNRSAYFIPSVCPEEGSFIGWKKARAQVTVATLSDSTPIVQYKPVIIKLLIPEDALRISGTSRKCRASKATVIDIQSLSGESLTDTKASSLYDGSFIYETGMAIEPDSFDRNRFNECSHGIHFFIDRQEAVYYES